MSCTFYRYKGGYFNGYDWCDKKECRIDEDTYSKYCKNYNYKYCPIFKHEESSGGCYITTIVCGILSKEDCNRVLVVLRCFRDNILAQDEKYYDLLKGYDNIGPIIASCIENDPDKQKMAQYLYSLLEKIADHVETRNYDRAEQEYEAMTLSLINYYNLKKIYNLNKDNDYDYKNFNPSLAGHGRKRERVNN